MKVAPSIIAARFTKIEEEIKAVEQAGADLLHLDIMDGVFVDNITFGPDISKEICSVATIPCDAHLMIIDPIKYIEQFAKAGARYITVHVESRGDKTEIIKNIHKLGKMAGITLNPETPLSNIIPYLTQSVDLVLVMSVHPGFYGQTFKMDMVERVKELYRIRETKKLNFAIEIDGGINEKTIKLVRQWVDIAVSGSYVFKSANIEEAIKNLKEC